MKSLAVSVHFGTTSKLALALLASSLPSDVHAQLTLTVLHSFQGGEDGKQPYARLLQASDGSLYGTTYFGGTNNAGTIYRVNPDGSANTPIYHFERSKFNPFGLRSPSGLIQGADGALYGTTGQGGAADVGCVFRIRTDGSGFTVLHSFSQPGGYEPTGGLIQGPDGMLYGTTDAGGIIQVGGVGAGTLFKISTNGTDYADVYLFGLFVGAPMGSMAPLLLGNDGALYGTTVAGGDSALAGGSGYGTVFKVNLDGSGAQVLHSFMPSGGDGQRPHGGLVQGSDGALYGTAQEGGSTSSGGSSGFGIIFKLNPDGSGYQIIHNFKSPAEFGATDASYPLAGLVIGVDGALYGSGMNGGISNLGAIFKLQPEGADYEVLYSFGSTAGDGAYPQAPLIRASDGGLFGTAQLGGQSNSGTIYRLAPAPTVISGLKPLPDGTVQIALTGAPHFQYRVEASTNHTDWVPITNVFNSTGTMQFTDPQAKKLRSRFYRAAWMP